MSVVKTSDRLKELMAEKGLRQVDILNLVKPYCEMYDVKMNKSDLSQYVSGVNEPSQKKLVVLGMALDVSEAWLMGLNVSRERKEFSDNEAVKDFELIDKMSLLTEPERQVVTDLIDSILRRKGINYPIN